MNARSPFATSTVDYYHKAAVKLNGPSKAVSGKYHLQLVCGLDEQETWLVLVRLGYNLTMKMAMSALSSGLRVCSWTN